MVVRPRVMAGIVVALFVCLALVWFVRSDATDGVATPAAPIQSIVATETDGEDGRVLHEEIRVVSEDERNHALVRAHVWRKPRVPIGLASFARNASAPDAINCKFALTVLGGTTPKFHCTRENGEVFRVKYGKGPEIPAEAAATRLLDALGFGADGVTLVRHLRCHGCPNEPFSMMKAVELTRAERLYRRVIDYSRHEDFEWVAVEQQFNARPIQTDAQKGWAFFELDKIDARQGGAPRAHVDALRLLAVFLSHWDNKAENQRMVCLSREWPEGTPCAVPFLLMQDVGATFGPSKLDLEGWEQSPIWEDRARCQLATRHLPYEGATLGEPHVSEAGRQFLGTLLSQLSNTQLTDLFSAARFDQPRGVFSAVYPVSDWVRVFRRKVLAVATGPRCQ